MHLHGWNRKETDSRSLIIQQPDRKKKNLLIDYRVLLCQKVTWTDVMTQVEMTTKVQKLRSKM